VEEKIANILIKGGVGVLPTDTIYGLVASALNKQAVEKVYLLKKRTPNKPFIILISNLDDLKHFKIHLDEKVQQFLQKIWPNPVSVILSCPQPQLKYLHRNINTLAFRTPNKPTLLKLLKKTGPLIAPSANEEGKPPSETIEEAKKYFGKRVDFYVNEGKLTSEPSTLISIDRDKIKILREGAFRISEKVV